MTVERTYDSAADVFLGEFEEIVGTLEKFQAHDNSIVITLSSGCLQFPAESPEGRFCRRKLEGRVGTSVAILRTPSPTQPIRIRFEELEEDDG